MHVCPECGEQFSEPGYCGRDGTALSAVGDDLLLGQMVGAYRIATLIGTGGMGRVYKGVHPQIGSRVAIKVLSRDCADSAELIERFFTEARAVNLIRHENIVNVIDLAQLTDRRPYIVMEYLDGLSLAKYIANHRLLGGEETVRIALQVLSALSAAHKKHIVHRDLKPDNLFITPEGRTKVLDFGIAKLRPEESGRAQATRDGSLLGTPHYMSPEQALARPVDARADIYSMGVILFECLTGRPPFQGASLYELSRAHIELSPPSITSLVPGASPQLDAVVQRALAKDPGQRWPDAAALADALARAVGVTLGPAGRAAAPAQPAPARDTHDGRRLSAPLPTQSDGPTTSRSRWPWIALAVVVVAGAATAVALSVAGREPTDDRKANNSDPSADSAPDRPDTGSGNTAPEPSALQLAAIASVLDSSTPTATAECPNPLDHCLPDDSPLFVLPRQWEPNYQFVELAAALGPVDAAGEGRFRTRRNQGELATKWVYRTHRARPADVAVGRMMIMFHDHHVDGVYRAPNTRADATTRRWWMARIVSIDPLAIGNYVLVSGGYQVHADNLRAIEGDTSDTAVVWGAEDSHFLKDGHWLISDKPLPDEGYDYVELAATIAPPSIETRSEGHFLLTRSGRQLWSAHCWRTRPATSDDVAVGTRVFMFHDNHREGVYRQPTDRTAALSRRWWTALVTDTSAAYKGQVTVDDKYLVDINALRVVREP